MDAAAFCCYKVKPDVVVLLGNEAWSSYRVTCVDSWHEIPVVLGYVKGAFIDYENKDKKLFSVADMMPMKESFGDFRITGYSYKDFVIENLSLIKQLQPHIRKVAFCYDNRYNMAFFESYINDLFEQIDSLDLRYMDGCKLSTPNYSIRLPVWMIPMPSYRRDGIPMPFNIPMHIRCSTMSWHVIRPSRFIRFWIRARRT